MIRNRFDAVVFDLDGTLIDSEPDLRHALNRTLAHAGRDTLNRDQVIKMIGGGIPNLVEQGFLATGGPPNERLEDVVAYFSEKYDGMAAELSEMFPGAAHVLSKLKSIGLKLGICTNKPEKPAYEILNAFNISKHIDTVVGGDTFPGIRKPDGRHLSAVLECLKISPDHAVMVGDNHNDASAAQELGIPFIVVAFGYAHGPVEALRADAVIEHFDELMLVLDRLATAT